MDGKRARLIDPKLDHPKIPAAPPAAPPRSHVLSEGWAAVLGLGWPLVFLVMLMLEPVPENPDVAASTIAVVVSLAFYAGLIATSVFAGARHRAAAPAAVLTGLVTVGMVASCPLSGHHSFGAWWFAELAVVGAMLAVSVAGLRQLSRR
jgi:hypothetical protein